MSLKKGKLIIENKEYESNIVTPDIHKLLKLKPDEIVALNNIEVTKGTPVGVETSEFTGYVSDAKNFTEVNSAYEFVRFHNMSARHIISACLIGNERTVLQEEYKDDNEHGTGKKLLAYMKEAKLNNCAIFVVRKYDGKHIGPQRFDHILEAAKIAVNSKLYNRVSNKF